MTVQEIQEIGFEKAVFGGYDMKSVDTFLERVAEEFAAMQKENAALKAKMKVLVDKIEEYRGVEDGMRRALMSAQSIAQETVDKAKAEAEQILAAAKNETENKVKTTQGEIALEEQKLKTARKYTSDFIYRVSAVYQAQAKALADLAKAEKLVREQAPKSPAQQQTQPLDQQVGQQVSNIIEDETAEKGDEPVAEATRRIPMPDSGRTEKNFDFGELKFGNDYDPKDVK
ncbi:DivIVA domain-containing protein [Agathobaculum sp. NTUH-O15-33]|uniref:DivIVA domain-containing protein n=1 Tax=Agathobaculum sp. NTUH-O15-33 TaxID=3079302 RepID=UPI002958B3DD|nr:DivIVA domain-containing protein [Agathobaculum sp. NTUH-O15-33]WNX86582.1 DivIVA domain-containing protein [Agathobaculum sp. NTUH-O15-33]